MLVFRKNCFSECHWIKPPDLCPMIPTTPQASTIALLGPGDVARCRVGSRCCWWWIAGLPLIIPSNRRFMGLVGKCLHEWLIFYGKCRYIYHAWILWYWTISSNETFWRIALRMPLTSQWEVQVYIDPQALRFVFDPGDDDCILGRVGRYLRPKANFL